MAMRAGLMGGLSILAVLALGACEDQISEQVPSVSESEDSEVARAVGEGGTQLSQRGEVITVEAQTGTVGTFEENCLITESSIAGIGSPLTLGDFAGAFPVGSKLVFEPSYMVDLGSFCLIQNNQERVCTFFFEAEVDGWDPEEEATGLFTSDPACRTELGIGPGSLVSDAVEAYGAADFAFSYDNEGREYVGFERMPGRMGFRVSSRQGEALVADVRTSQNGEEIHWPNGEFGGDYRASDTPYMTSVALPDATIVEVSLP